MIRITIDISAETAGEFVYDLKALVSALDSVSETASGGDNAGAAPVARRTRASKTATSTAALTANGAEEATGASGVNNAPDPSPAEPETAKEEPAKTYSVDDVRAAMTSIIDALGDDGPTTALSLLKEVCGVEKASLVPEDKRGAYVDAAAEVVAKAKK